MWLMLELPDECQDAVDELIAWHDSPERMVSSAGVVVCISPGEDFGDRKLFARVKDIQTQ